MSPHIKDLGKIQGIGNAEWFNLTFERTERQTDKGKKISG